MTDGQLVRQALAGRAEAYAEITTPKPFCMKRAGLSSQPSAATTNAGTCSAKWQPCRRSAARSSCSTTASP